MNEQAFELTSLAMRYWFTGLMLAAVLCAFRLAVLDHRKLRRERQTAPNMEYVGEFLVVKGAGDVLFGSFEVALRIGDGGQRGVFVAVAVIVFAFDPAVGGFAVGVALEKGARA